MITKDGIDSVLSMIRNDLAVGYFDNKELDMLARLLDIFSMYVDTHRKEDKGA